MFNIFIKWLITTASLLGAAYFIPGMNIDNVYTALIVAVLIGFINLIVRPIILVLTLPINLLTFGLFTLVINGLLLYFVASFVKGFYLESFWAAFLGAVVVSFFSWLGNKLFD